MLWARKYGLTTEARRTRRKTIQFLFSVSSVTPWCALSLMSAEHSQWSVVGRFVSWEGMRHFMMVVGIVALLSVSVGAAEPVIRIGIIGCDTSHVPAFAKQFNDPKATGDLAGFKVVVAFAGGSQDVES